MHGKGSFKMVQQLVASFEKMQTSIAGQQQHVEGIPDRLGEGCD